MLAPVGAASIVLPMTPQKKWAFKTTQNTGIIARALVQDMVARHIDTVGFIGFADAYGDDWLNVFEGLATANRIRIVAVERYQRRSEEHTSELQSLMRISYAVFCLTTQKKSNQSITSHNTTDAQKKKNTT